MRFEELRQGLSIDPEDLDRCLVQQPDLYYHVAELYANALSEKDGAKLDLEEASADLDMQLRKDAQEKEERITEEGFKQRLRASPVIKKLNRSFLELREQADILLALKESYQQRSFMLRELVARQISEINNLGLGKSTGIRNDRAESIRNRAGEMRRERRASSE